MQTGMGGETKRSEVLHPQLSGEGGTCRVATLRPIPVIPLVGLLWAWGVLWLWELNITWEMGGTCGDRRERAGALGGGIEDQRKDWKLHRRSHAGVPRRAL